MILVNAANGQQGQRLLPHLLAAGAEVRACVRSEPSAEALRARGVAEVVIGDMSDPTVIARAMAGVSTVYHVCPGIHPQERAMGFAMIDAAQAAGVRHFVFSSVLHAILTDLVQHEIKRDIEEHLLSSGLDYTILQPAIYMAPRRFTRAVETGVLKTGWSLDRVQTLVDIGDIGEVAATVLLDPGAHAGATYELAGPDRLTARDMGAILAETAGKPIAVEEVGSDAYLKALFGDQDLAAMPHEVAVAHSLTARYSSNDFVGCPNVLGWLLGRSPTSFARFAAATYGARH